jgi:hypothetical protein
MLGGAVLVAGASFAVSAHQTYLSLLIICSISMDALLLRGNKEGVLAVL